MALLPTHPSTRPLRRRCCCLGLSAKKMWMWWFGRSGDDEGAVREASARRGHVRQREGSVHGTRCLQCHHQPLSKRIYWFEERKFFDPKEFSSKTEGLLNQESFSHVVIGDQTTAAVFDSSLVVITCYESCYG